MAIQITPDIERLVREHMATGRYSSESELLIDALRMLPNYKADLAAVQVAIDDMEAGDAGRPLGEVVVEIREKHGWTQK